MPIGLQSYAGLLQRPKSLEVFDWPLFSVT
jgi:hypothetical protein